MKDPSDSSGKLDEDNMSADSEATLVTTETFEWKPGRLANIPFALMLNAQVRR